MEFTKPQVAALVLGYLRREKLDRLAQKFARTCSHLVGSTHIKMGKYVITRVAGMELVDFLEEYASMYTIIQAKLDETDFYKTRKKSTLVEQLLYLLEMDLTSSRCSTPITWDVETTAKRDLPGNCFNEENERTVLAKSRSESDSTDSVDAIEVPEILTQSLLENHELHEKIADAINSVRNITERRTADQKIGAGASEELEAVIQTVVQRTEEDPMYNKLIDEIIGTTTEVEMSKKCNETADVCDISPLPPTPVSVTNPENGNNAQNCHLNSVKDISAANSSHGHVNNIYIGKSSVASLTNVADTSVTNLIHTSTPCNVQKVFSNFVNASPLPQINISTAANQYNTISEAKRIHVLDNIQISSAVNVANPIYNGTNVGTSPTNVEYATPINSHKNATLDNLIYDEMSESSPDKGGDSSRSSTANPNVTVAANRSLPSANTIDEYNNAAVQSIINVSQNPVNRIDPQNNVLVYDGTLDSYNNPVYINTDGMLVMQPHTSSKQYYMMPMNDILTMPTVIVSQDTSQNFTVAAKPQTPVKVLKTIHPKRDTSTRDFLLKTATPTASCPSEVPLRSAIKSKDEVARSHVRNLDFSAEGKFKSGTKTLESKSKSESESNSTVWDKDLRDSTADCKNRPGPSKRKPLTASKLRRKERETALRTKDADALPSVGKKATEEVIKKDKTRGRPKKSGTTDGEKDKKDTKDTVNEKDKKDTVDEKTDTDNEKKDTVDEKKDTVNEKKDTVNEKKDTSTLKVAEAEAKSKPKVVEQMTPEKTNPLECKELIPKTPEVKDGMISSSVHCTPFNEVLEEQLIGVDLISLPTPCLPITPGFTLTPPMIMNEMNQRGTDYSTSSSYYQPSDTEQNQSIETLIEECRRLEERSPNKHQDKSTEEVVIETTQIEITTEELKTNCTEQLRRFNESIIGRKNLSLLRKDLESSSSESDGSKSDDEAAKKKINSTAAISEIISTVKTKETLVEVGTHTKLLSHLEEVRQRTVMRIKNPPEAKKTRKKPKPKRKPKTDEDDEAKKLVDGLAERGIHLMPTPQKAPPEINNTCINFDTKTYTECEHVVHDVKHVVKKAYDPKLLTRSFQANVFIEDLNQELPRIMNWTDYESLLDLKPKKTKKKTSEEAEIDDELMDFALMRDEPVSKPAVIGGRKRKSLFRDDALVDKKTKTTGGITLLKRINVDSFLDQIHGA